MYESTKRRDIMEGHYADIASSYDDLRSTDVEPIFEIRRYLEGPLKGIDVGCGSGRYTDLLLRHLGPSLEMVGTDTSREMLDILADRNCNCETVLAESEAIPLPDSEYDFITTFNAIHHFNLSGFFDETSRLLKSHGLKFIYTRTPDQNSQTIWGQYFPMFKEIETRLPTVNKMLRHAKDDFLREDVIEFVYSREATIEELVAKARSFHYSTFRLIPEELFESCVSDFIQNIKSAFNGNKVSWTDRNTLFIFRRI